MTTSMLDGQEIQPINTRSIMSKYIPRSSNLALRASAIVLFSIVFFSSPPTHGMADTPSWVGSKADAEIQVKELLQLLNFKHEEFRKKDSKSNGKLEAFVKGLGFESVSELLDATVGNPVPTYSLHLDTLLGITEEDLKKEDFDPWPLLTETRSAIFPILVQKQIRSSVTVFVTGEQKEKLSVKLGPLGSRSDTELLKQIEEISCKCFVIRASALNRQFLGEGDKTEKKSFKIRVIADGPGELRKGAVLDDASQFFAELLREANNPKYVMPDRPRRKAKP